MEEEGHQWQSPMGRFFAGGNLPALGKLDNSTDCNVEATWWKWKRQQINYEVASKLKEEGSEHWAAVFLTLVGTETVEIYDGFHFKEGENTNIDSVSQKFKEFYVADTNEEYESNKFHRRD